MSTSTAPTTPRVPNVLVLKRADIFVGSFVIGLVANLVLIIAVFTSGVSTGVAGTFGFDWSQFQNTLTFLFGGIGSALWLIGGIVVLAATGYAFYWLSSHGHHKWVVVASLIGMFVGGFILWRLVDWSNFGFGFVPLLILIAYTAFWAGVASFIIPLRPKLSRKRGTN
ncbi:MAG: hypothetical protein WAR37_01240 [Candidatus Microsaccharimonas sp.]